MSVFLDAIVLAHYDAYSWLLNCLRIVPAGHHCDRVQPGYPWPLREPSTED